MRHSAAPALRESMETRRDWCRIAIARNAHWEDTELQKGALPRMCARSVLKERMGRRTACPRLKNVRTAPWELGVLRRVCHLQVNVRIVRLVDMVYSRDLWTTARVSCVKVEDILTNWE